MAFDLSVRLGLCAAEDAARFRRHLLAVGLPVKPTNIMGVTWDVDSLINIMRKDKKVSQGMMTFILTKSIGDSIISNDVPVDILYQCIFAAIEND